MRVLLLFVTLCSIISVANAQYIPHTGQPFQFISLYNPAFSGVENFGDLKLGYRYQWTGFNDNAPTFGNLLYNMRVKYPVDMKRHAPRSSVSNFDNVVPQRKLGIHGLGVNIFSEKIGPIRRAGGGVNYAIHMPLNKKTFISGGLGAMLENTRLRDEDLYWGQTPDPDPVREKLLNGAGNQTDLWIRAGALLYSDDFYLGFSVYPVGAALKSSDVDVANTLYKGTFQAGTSFPLGDEYIIRPSIMAIWQVNNTFLIDYHAKIYLQEKAWFGLSYRDVKSGIVSAGLFINETFAASYSFEFSVGRLQQFSGGSHDLVLLMRINNFKKVNQWAW